VWQSYYGYPIGEVHERESGCLAGDPGADGPQDPGDARPPARLRDCARIEQTSGQLLEVNYGTLYPALLKLEQEGYIASEWGVSDHHRKAKYYKLTRAGHKRLEKAAHEWEQTTAIVARFLCPGEEHS